MSKSNRPGSTLEAKVSRAYALKSVPEARSLYDEWATTYDDDLDNNYNSPGAAADAIAKNLPANASNVEILDAGCGTGLAGLAILANEGLSAKVKAVDGLDLSQGMLDVARRSKAYRILEVADLSKRIEVKDGIYDVVVCVGTLTHGHVGPSPALEEFVRVLKQGGLVVGTITDGVWKASGFEAEVHRLRSDGIVEVLGTESFGINKGETEGAKMLVMRKR